MSRIKEAIGYESALPAVGENDYYDDYQPEFEEAA